MQLIREGGLVVRARAHWWSRAAAHLCPESRWEKVDGSVHIAIAEVNGLDVEEFVGLISSDIEVCRFTGDRRYGHAEVFASPRSAAKSNHFPLVTHVPLMSMGIPS